MLGVRARRTGVTEAGRGSTARSPRRRRWVYGKAHELAGAERTRRVREHLSQRAQTPPETRRRRRAGQMRMRIGSTTVCNPENCNLRCTAYAVSLCRNRYEKRS